MRVLTISLTVCQTDRPIVRQLPIVRCCNKCNRSKSMV